MLANYHSTPKRRAFHVNASRSPVVLPLINEARICDVRQLEQIDRNTFSHVTKLHVEAEYEYSVGTQNNLLI